MRKICQPHPLITDVIDEFSHGLGHFESPIVDRELAQRSCLTKELVARPNHEVVDLVVNRLYVPSQLARNHGPTFALTTIAQPIES